MQMQSAWADRVGPPKEAKSALLPGVMQSSPQTKSLAAQTTMALAQFILVLPILGDSDATGTDIEDLLREPDKPMALNDPTRTCKRNTPSMQLLKLLTVSFQLLPFSLAFSCLILSKTHHW